MLFRAQDGLLVPYKLDTRNHFVKDLQEALESILKDVRANSILASLLFGSPTWEQQLTLVATPSGHPTLGNLS